MAKTIFEFDEFEDRDDINIIVNRHKLVTALYELANLRRNLYKEYANIIVVKDNEIVFKDGRALKEYNTDNTEEYINTDDIINKIDGILEEINSLIN